MSDLPSRAKWNVPHASEYAWDIAAEMTSFERRQIAARWLEGRLVDRDTIDYEAATDTAVELLTVEPRWDASATQLVIAAAVGGNR